MKLVIVYGFGNHGCDGCVYWTGDAWTASAAMARRYTSFERDTIVLPRGGCWTLTAA